MIWLLPRALTAIVAMIVGGLAGLLAGHANAQILGVLIGGALAVGVIAIFDTARGRSQIILGPRSCCQADTAGAATCCVSR